MKKIWKRVVAILSITVFSLIFVLSDDIASLAEEGDASESTEENSLETETNYNVGDIIKFGRYEQDGNEENGKEEIEWEVLSVEADRILLLSKYALDSKQYHFEKTSVTWENCSLRKWLNNDFKNIAFSSEEQKEIMCVTVVNEDNAYYGTEGGNNTQD